MPTVLLLMTYNFANVIRHELDNPVYKSKLRRGQGILVFVGTFRFFLLTSVQATGLPRSVGRVMLKLGVCPVRLQNTFSFCL